MVLGSSDLAPGEKFMGSFDHVLDDKGRASLPREFRKLLAEEAQPAYLTAKPKCLAIYPYDEFHRLRRDYAELHIDSRERLERLHVGNAQLVNVDRQGRILIPPALRRHAGLQRDILFLGVGDRIEIWDRERHAVELQQTSDDYAHHASNRKDRAR
jgi:MraZ protein